MKLKTVLIILAVIVIVALLGVAAYFVVIPKIVSMTTPNANVPAANSNFESQTGAVDNGNNENEAATVAGKDTVTAASSTGFSGVMANENYMFAAKEEEFVEQFVMAFFGAEPASVAYAALATEIPTDFVTTSNMVSTLNAGTEISYGSEIYSDPHLMSCNLVSIINDQFDRHSFIVSTHENGTEVFFQGSVIVDLLNHKIVHMTFNKINPVHVEMVESQYNQLQIDLVRSKPGVEKPVYDGNQRTKAMLAAIYSYSPYIDGLYWSTVPDYLRHASDLEITSDDIAYWNMIDRLPTNDGCGLRVLSIGEPMLINKNGNYNYFTCDISYRTDHAGTAPDYIINSTLRFYVNSDNGKIVYLTESNTSTSEITDLAASNINEPTIEELLGKN